MNLEAVLQKTEKGIEEIKTHREGLEPRLRTLLIVVNGKVTAAELVKQFERMGNVQPMLAQLVARGFVREMPPGEIAIRK